MEGNSCISDKAIIIADNIKLLFDCIHLNNFIEINDILSILTNQQHYHHYFYHQECYPHRKTYSQSIGSVYLGQS